MELLEKLKTDSEFITEQWLTEEDVLEVTKELYSKVNEYKSEISEYVVFKTKQMQEDKILWMWTMAEIERLQELFNGYQKKVNNAITWIDSVMKMCWMEKLETPLCKLSYRKSEAVVFTDEWKIPVEYVVTKESKVIDKMKIKEVLKSWWVVEWAMLEIRQNLQFK